MKISSFNVTWWTKQRNNNFQFRFHSLNGWTDVSLVTRARFGAMYNDNDQGYAKTTCE